MKNRLRRWWVPVLAALLLSACSTTKHLPEGETLYTGIRRIDIANKDKSDNGARTIVKWRGR